MNIRFSLISGCSLLFLWSNGFSQQKFRQKFNSRVVYRIEYKADSTHPERVKSENMELLVNDSISLFRSVNEGMVDSAGYLPYQNKDNGALMGVLSSYSTSFRYHIVKNSNQIIYSQEMIYGNMVADYRDSKNEMHWNLMPDTLTVNGLHCNKAVLNEFGGRKWVAWYCSDIPLSDGPYKFCGLPGLIVRIGDEKENWVFTLIGIVNSPTDVVINYNEDLPYVKMDRLTFFKDKRYFLFNAFEIASARGSYKAVSPEDQKKVKAVFAIKAAADNNWIELH